MQPVAQLYLLEHNVIVVRAPIVSCATLISLCPHPQIIFLTLSCVTPHVTHETLANIFARILTLQDI